MPYLSAVVITLNEERNIKRCLESLSKVADDIVVLDSYSTDQTKDICHEYKVNFIQRKWEGYSKTKNFANQQAKHDWLLSLDADEELSSELISSILIAKESEENYFFKIHRRACYCGHWIKYSGWQRDIKVRLFDRKKAKWEGDFVHEELVYNKKIPAPLLKGFCYHYTASIQKEHLETIERYSGLGAQKLYQAGKRTYFLSIYLKAMAEFLQKFLLKRGFLDGKAGFWISWNSSKAIFLRYSKLYKLQKNK